MEMLNLASPGWQRIRFVGPVSEIIRGWLLDQHKAYNFSPEFVSAFEITNGERRKLIRRFVFPIIDRTDNKIKLADFPMSIMRQVGDFVISVNAKRRRHGRKQNFDPCGEYGLEMDVFITGNGINRKYTIAPRVHRLTASDKKLIKEQSMPNVKALLKVI